MRRRSASKNFSDEWQRRPPRGDGSRGLRRFAQISPPRRSARPASKRDRAPQHHGFPRLFPQRIRLCGRAHPEVKLPNLKLQYDLYHRQRMRGAVVEGLEQFWPIIGHVQVASAPKRQEPGTANSTISTCSGNSTSSAIGATSAPSTDRRRGRARGLAGLNGQRRAEIRRHPRTQKQVENGEQ